MVILAFELKIEFCFKKPGMNCSVNFVRIRGLGMSDLKMSMVINHYFRRQSTD